MRTLLLALCLSLVALGCDNPKRPAETSVVKAPAAKAKAKTVTVSKTGTKFDPPVQIAQIPAGAHYCDMGTVHYARLERGDGKCTECGMMLKTKSGDAAPKADDKGHEGHNH